MFYEKFSLKLLYSLFPFAQSRFLFFKTLSTAAAQVTQQVSISLPMSDATNLVYLAKRG